MCAAYITGYVLTFMHNLAHTFKPSHIGALGRSENHGGRQIVIQGFTYLNTFLEKWRGWGT